MSTTIPFDPTLALGNIVPDEKLAVLQAISELQAPIDAALGELNSAILLKRQLKMTMQDLANLAVDTTDVQNSLGEVDKQISSAAKEYAQKSVAALPQIAAKRGTIAQVGRSLESPIDYNKSQLKQMPLSADSLTMDSQYFSFDQDGQSSQSQLAAIKSFISASTSFLGNDRSVQATGSATSQLNQQLEQHDIEGTLVITANCTHKNASVFAPFIVDVDKAIRVWNEMFPQDQIKTNDPSSIWKIAEQQETDKAKFFNLVSGATYGSSFVGMVHVLRTTGTESSQQMYATAASLQAQMDVGTWFSSLEGKFGVATSFANSVKQLLSSQRISSHVSLVTTGIIPTIVANDVQLAVKEFAQFDPAAMTEQLAALQNAAASDQASVAQAASSARTGGQMMSIQASKIKSVISAVSEHQDGSNKMLDINSLMTAFTDYVQKASAGGIGVPVTYYLKPITAAQLAQMWVAKYYPAKYVTSAGDDSTPAEPAANSAASNGAAANTGT